MTEKSHKLIIVHFLLLCATKKLFSDNILKLFVNDISGESFRSGRKINFLPEFVSRNFEGARRGQSTKHYHKERERER